MGAAAALKVHTVVADTTGSETHTVVAGITALKMHTDVADTTTVKTHTVVADANALNMHTRGNLSPALDVDVLEKIGNPIFYLQ